MKRRFAAALIVLGSACGAAESSEPNDSFAEATILAPGILSVTDSLSSSGSPPDTLLGIRDLFGDIYYVDDDGSPVGDGSASGIGGVPTNSGSIDFVVTGYGDDDFIGAHSESGYYEVFVRAFDFFNDPVDFFSETRRLEPGVVHEFSFSDPNWIGGSYDVYIDNLIGSSDLDFFTFTGLKPGAEFTARTHDPSALGIDTLLGWFDATGNLLESDDDDGGGVLSRIDGIVPASGTLTFAVTGFGDDSFLGNHSESGDYQLLLELMGNLPGDYNQDGKVDAADYTVWRDRLGQTSALPNDDTIGVGPDDYTRWKTHFGQHSGSGAVEGLAAATPEPATLSLVFLLATLGAGSCRAKLSFASA